MREAIGVALREKRLEKGLTQRQIVKSASVSLGYLSELERGIKEGSSDLLQAICEAMYYDMPELLIDAARKLSEHDLSLLREYSNT